MSLIQSSEEHRAWMRSEAMKHAVKLPPNESKRFLLAELLVAYMSLSPEQRKEFEGLMQLEENREAREMFTTYFEQGLERGLEEGQRRVVLALLEDRFGSLSPETVERVAQWPAADLTDLARRVPHAGSLSELGLGSQS